MRSRNFLLFLFVFSLNISVFAQTHLAVPLGDPVYVVLEQAQMRGLTGALPSVRPYSRAKILSLINEILDNDEERKHGGLSDAERKILEQFRNVFKPERNGLDLVRGTHSGETISRDIYFSYELGFGMDLEFSGSYFPVAGGYKYTGEPLDIEAPNYERESSALFEGADHVSAKDKYLGYDNAVYVHFKGDLGSKTSYGLGLSFRVLQSPRTVLGLSTNDYGWIRPASGTYEEPRKIFINSEPLAYFPYSYKKRWDAHLFASDGLSQDGQLVWPESTVMGYSMIPEFAGTLLNDHVQYRIARHDREWAGNTRNSSLVLSESAQPFLGAEVTITPFDWISISSMTGTLEFGQFDVSQNINNAKLKESSAVSQNMFSIVMLELNYKNYFQFDMGSSAIYHKRLELAYLFPFADNFVSQNSLGDFDNLAAFFNIQGQYPGIGKAWFSFFLDEGNPLADNFFGKTRNMFALQVGGAVHIPWIPFSSLTFSYSKIEPYTYTHNRIDIPWSSYIAETEYTNFGKSLGHYLPPNSDEILIRFDTMMVPKSLFSLQCQLIRHGADYGSRQVIGSSIWNELGGSRDSYKKYFLRDGAYQWIHILKLTAEYSIAEKKLPVKLFGECGVVYSYFTDIYYTDIDYLLNNELPSIPKTNSGSFPYKIINTPEYPHQLYFIGTIGVKIFPK